MNTEMIISNELLSNLGCPAGFLDKKDIFIIPLCYYLVLHCFNDVLEAYRGCLIVRTCLLSFSFDKLFQHEGSVR